MNKKYLAFIDYIGKNLDSEKFLYRFDFTDDTDTVWGDYFNISPAIIVPDLQPEENTISRSCKVEFDKKINLAKRNSCFSMQDAFDGIISLGFTELSEENIIYCDSKPLYFDFSEEYETVKEKLEKCGYSFIEISDKQIGDETIIDNLIEEINTDEEEPVNESGSTDFFKLELDEYEELMTLKVKDNISYNEINEILFNSEYNRVDYISKEGEYTLRGHIIDIYSYKHAYPIRIILFGNEVEKIVKFDENEQKEIETINEVTIYKIRKDKIEHNE